MDIPAIFATWEEDGLRARNAWFRGIFPVAEPDSVPFSKAVSRISRSEQRRPAVVVDADSIAMRGFSERVMKEMRIRGSDIWLTTWVEDANDLFDAFNTSVEMVMGPLHAVASRDDLEDIVSVSDSFVPMIFVVRGEAVEMGGRHSGIHDVLRRLADAELYHPCILDTDGSITDDGWGSIFDGFPLAIPFTRRAPAPDHPGWMWITPLRPENRETP